MKIFQKHRLLLFASLLIANLCFAGDKNKKLYISDHKIPCAGDFECMQVKEKTKEAWHVYSDTIEGFDYQEGYNYTILVAVSTPKNPYEGRNNDRYTLVKVVSKTKTDYNPAVRLEGHKWMLTSLYDGRKKLTFNTDSTKMSIQFIVKTGRINAHGACNGIAGGFSVQGNSIKISSISSTKMMCAGPGMSFERLYLDFLGKASAYDLQGNMLTIKCTDGANMEFRAE